ncbi:hypothetical protein Tco_1212272, partial [Tanacetum coccineum]
MLENKENHSQNTNNVQCSLPAAPLEDIVNRTASRTQKTSLPVSRLEDIVKRSVGRPRKELSSFPVTTLENIVKRKAGRPSKASLPNEKPIVHKTPGTPVVRKPLSAINESTPIKPISSKLGKSNEYFKTPKETVTQVGSKNSKSTIQYGPVPVNADMQTNQKGLGLRNNHRSRFRLNTPVKFNIGSTSCTKDKEIHVEQPSILTSFEQNFKGKLVGRKSSRRINFTTPHHEGEYEIQPNAFVGISKDYIDHGDPRFECSSCGAMLWFAEKNRGASNTNSDSYSLCCMRGKVKLDVDIMKPPKLLKDLITKQHPKSSSFLENIRRYNSMFAFTSLGGTQDTSVNTGRGPYCYRLHGENKHRIGDLLPEEGKPPKFCQLYIYDTENEIRNKMQGV